MERFDRIGFAEALGHVKKNRCIAYRWGWGSDSDAYIFLYINQSAIDGNSSFESREVEAGAVKVLKKLASGANEHYMPSQPDLLCTDWVLDFKTNHSYKPSLRYNEEKELSFMEQLRAKNKHDLLLFASVITASASLVVLAACLL